MEAYGVGAVALIVFAFYTCRRAPAFMLASAAIVGAFAAATYQSLQAGRTAEWGVMCAGLVASVAGLTSVRAMLTRSVSLHLLMQLDGGRVAPFEEEIGARVRDMRAAGLIRTIAGRNTLTTAGRMVSGFVSTCYFLLKIDG